ncbi:hypothetical protein [Streptomyces mirabilis]|uniref:hypothetical protein n=1 Tax=Streptomyces mirabilis TaxID=68239 RepID=UPI0036B93ADA
MVNPGRLPVVEALDESRKIPWSVRRRLHRERKKGMTGVLLFAEIREPIRGLTNKSGVISLWENDAELCYRSSTARKPKFVVLSPGPHRIDFRVLRLRKSKSTSFQKVVQLEEGDILVAMCDPVQPNVFYRRSPEADSWIVGVVSPREKV